MSMPPIIPATIPAANFAPGDVRPTEPLASTLVLYGCSPMGPIGLAGGLLLIHENFGELFVLFEDRDHLVDQGLEIIVAGVLTILLELANQSFVIGAGLLQEKLVKSGAVGGLQFPFHSLFVRSLVSRSAYSFEISALLRYRNYRMILDQLICVSSNPVYRAFFPGHLG